MLASVPRFRVLVFAFLLVSMCRAEPAPDPDQIGYHRAKLDAAGKLLPWYGDSPAQAYDHVIRLVWDFWRDMRRCPNGVPTYMQHQVWKPEDTDPRGLGGDQINMALSSWNLLYGYLGDARLKENMIFMADHWISHGMTDRGEKWANLPYPYNLELHSGRYDGDMRAGKGYLQPDKAASFGAELITVYKITGDAKYVAYARAIADSLAAHIQPGDAENSPWPYRVNAVTGEVHKAVKKDGTPISASYTANWSPALRMYRGLIALGQGDAARYRQCIDIVTRWLKQYPLQTNRWGPFFEDIETRDYSDTEINADTLAFYILENPDWDAQWKDHAKRILAWSFETFQNHEFEKFGVTAVNEQTVYKVPGNSHTSRHASTELMYCEKTADCATRQDAIRRLNWATYTVDTDGKNRYPRDDVWLTDGYGDYVRHYLRAMASAPELAPEDQNHLLRTSSVIQSINYGGAVITYRKFDANSRELIKIGAGQPKAITGGSMKWDAGRKVLAINATSRMVSITLN